MRSLTRSIFTVLLFACSAVSQQLTEKDLKSLEGVTWVGELTYLDYRTKKRTSIKSNVTISSKDDTPGTWLFVYTYPDEPRANSKSHVVLSADGRTFNEQKIVEMKKLPDSFVRIITVKDGDDAGKKAVFRYTYTFNTKTFTLRKEVRYEGETDWFERNSYRWAR